MKMNENEVREIIDDELRDRRERFWGVFVMVVVVVMAIGLIAFAIISVYHFQHIKHQFCESNNMTYDGNSGDCILTENSTVFMYSITSCPEEVSDGYGFCFENNCPNC